MKNEKICRICLENGELKSIFATNCLSHVQMSCAEAVSKISTIIIKEDDDFPKTICKKCLSKLKVAYKFRILCEDSNLKLIQQANEKIDNSMENQTYSDENLELDNKSQNLNTVNDTKNEIISSFKRKKKNSTLNTENSDGDSSNVFDDKMEPDTNDENTHQTKHKNGRQFQCEICAKVFLHAATLRMHLLVHKKELPFRCTHPGCDKAFPLNSRLKLHQKVHTNERNFICQYCSHAARDKQQLTVHIRYFHTKEKNFLCGTCGKGFVSPQARYYHAKRHENIRNHHCPHCEKSFVFAFGLQEHLVTHTGEKRFQCSLCDVRFSRKAHKINHEMRIHGIKKPTNNKISNFSPPQSTNDR